MLRMKYSRRYSKRRNWMRLSQLLQKTVQQTECAECYFIHFISDSKYPTVSFSLSFAVDWIGKQAICKAYVCTWLSEVSDVFAQHTSH